jgi:hypothetical protein
MKTTLGFFWLDPGADCANTVGATIDIDNTPTKSLFKNIAVSML